MCGIAGIKRFMDEPITLTEIRLMLLGIEHRGNEATGIALINPDGTVHVHKKDTPAWNFVKDDETEKFLADFLNPETKTVILHTRLATVGNPKKNENNHPMFADNVAVVHNGGISNHFALFSSEHLQRNCETDSDILRAILDRDGITKKGINNLNKLAGSAAIAAIATNHPDLLLLGRSGSPIKYAISQEKLWWASEMDVVQKAVRPVKAVRGFWAREVRPNVSYFSMLDNSAYIVDDNGVKSRHEFNTCVSYHAPTYNVRANFSRQQRKWHSDLKTEQEKRTTIHTPGSSAPIIIRSNAVEKADHISGLTDIARPGKKLGACPKCTFVMSHDINATWVGKICANKKCQHPLDELDKTKAA